MEKQEQRPLNLYREQFDLIDRRPATVIRQTDKVLDFYHRPEIPLSSHLVCYLVDRTLPFIAQVRDGALHYRELSRKSEKHYLTTLRSLGGNGISRYSGEVSEEFGDAAEAFDIALVTFGRIAREYSLATPSQELPTSTKGMFRPPFTIEDYFKRTTELYLYVKDVLSTSAPRNDRQDMTPYRIRGRAFFEVGAETPLAL